MTAQHLDTGTQDLLATLDAGVLTLTLNRPEARNAMSKAMNQALQEQLTAAEFNPAVKCLVLTGAGKGFCAGGDVKGMAASGDGTVGAQTIDEAIARQRHNQRATAGKYPCEQLRHDVRWHRVPDPAWPWHPQGRPLIDVARQAGGTPAEVRHAA